MRYKNIIFDLDGTLIDTEEAVLSTWRHTLGEYGCRFAPADLRLVLGITDDLALKKLNVRVGKDFEERFQRNYLIYGQNAKFFAGAEDVLAKLKEDGCSLGVVTSRYRSECAVFAGLRLESFFDLILCADDTEHHKPHPEPLLKYLSVRGARPKDCIYIGDMPTDAECAKAAGLASGLVCAGGEGEKQSSADFIFRSLPEMYAVLSGGDRREK